MSGPAFWRQVNLNIYLNFQHRFLDLTVSGERPYIWFFSFSPSQRPNCNGQAPFLTSRGIDHFPDLLWGGGNRPVVLVGIPFCGPGGNTIWGSWCWCRSWPRLLSWVLTSPIFESVDARLHGWQDWATGLWDTITSIPSLGLVFSLAKPLEISLSFCNCGYALQGVVTKV